MSLLALERVSKGYGSGARARTVLNEVSLELEAGELAVVWGLRRSGRSTLLRLASGMEAPDTGAVWFGGSDLADQGDAALGAGIGYCRKSLGCPEGQVVIDEVMLALLASGVSPTVARSRAHTALARAEVERCAELAPDELDSAEAVRVALARTLALEPRLLVIDEPVKGVDLLERDLILGLLRSLADEGIAVLASTGDPAGLSGVDRAFVLGDGELRGATPELAPVVPLRRAHALRARG
jgi:ABC-type lipoprotein export system ATPase subunit